MKKNRSAISLLLASVMILCLAGCGGGASTSDYSWVGTWEYSAPGNEIGAVYNLKEDGTGTYTMTAGEEEVTYELKYEVKDHLLLVTYLNNEIFSEDDVFENEFHFEDENTVIVKDSTGEEMTFEKKKE